MSRDFFFHEERALLARLVHNYNKEKEPLVFLVGSGLTSPTRKMPGVLDVKGVIELIRAEFESEADVLEQLDEELNANPTNKYQTAFQHLGGRRSPNYSNRIIRNAVIRARVPGDPYSDKAQRLGTDHKIGVDECKELCNTLESDFRNWSIRPGLKCLGEIITEFQSHFGSMVITTNFDPLIEVSINLAGGRAERLVFPGDAPFNWGTVERDVCRVIHIHGDWSGLDTLHTSALLERERPYLESDLAALIREKVVIVVGYGGWEDAFTRALQRINHDAKAQPDVLWAFYERAEREIHARYRHVLKKLTEGTGGSRITFYRNIDADRFFPLLLDKLREVRDASLHIPVSKSTKPEAFATPPPSPPDKIPTTPEGEPNNQISTFESDVAIVPDNEAFILRLQDQYSDTVRLDEIPDNESQEIQQPKFMLFNRNDKVVMAIIPQDCKTNHYLLQKTTEPHTECTLLSDKLVDSIGFAPKRVHPMFSDPQGAIYRIYLDAELLVQVILFPNSKVALPVYNRDGTQQKVLTSIGVFLDVMVEMHGLDKIVFANIVRRNSEQRSNSVLEKLIAAASILTRFAPTPSSRLHLGNARTALATYLLSSREIERSRFYLRIDNTDPVRSIKWLVPTIKEELRWLGMDWDEANDTFKQDDPNAYDAYKRLLRVLGMADLTELDANGTILLKSMPLSNYYCVYFDWREGARIVHSPPRNQQWEERRIKLFRSEENGWSPFYRYAGLVDDIRLQAEKNQLMYVIRDNRQLYLTQVQAHIRQALEIARQTLKSNPEAQRLFRDSGIDPLNSIPLPLYIHVPVVTDNGEVERKINELTNVEANNRPKYTVLRKRRKPEEEDLEKFSLNYLRRRQVLPESIAAYLVATIIRPKTANGNWKDHLASIASVFAHLGVNQGLHLLAQTFNLDDLVRSQKPLRCNLDDIWAAERLVLRSMPGWRLKYNIKQALKELEDNESEIGIDVIERMRAECKAFGSWARVLAVAGRPKGVYSPRSTTDIILKNASSEATRDGSIVEQILVEIAKRRHDLKAASGTMKDSPLSHLLEDLRIGLTASVSSPRIEVLLPVLGDDEVELRLKRFKIREAI